MTVLTGTIGSNSAGGKRAGARRVRGSGGTAPYGNQHHIRRNQLNIPIEDAVTVAYVGIVHAISELKEAEDYTESGRMIECVYDALEDLVNARNMLRPYVRESDG